MNESFTSSLFMAVMFVLRCLIPLGILFGISYLLRRLELVNEHSDEALIKVEDTGTGEPSEEVVVKETAKNSPPSKKKKNGREKEIRHFQKEGVVTNDNAQFLPTGAVVGFCRRNRPAGEFYCDIPR